MNLIDRDKLTDKLKQYANDMCVSLWNDIVCLINEQPIVGRWISVERELPKDTDDVWVIWKRGDVLLPAVAFYERSTWYESMTINIIDVIAWKPIEPYEVYND